MGHAYKGGAETYHCAKENFESLISLFPFSKGYFGEKGLSSSSHVRNLVSENPLKTAREFYDLAAYGGYEEELTQGAWKTTMEDGTVFTMRQVSGSKDGSPAVDINIRRSRDNPGIKMQKIHFVKREN